MDETFVNNLATALRKVGTIHTVGEEWVSYIGEIPVGGVPYCGQMVTRSTYSALWSYAQAKGLVKTEAEWQRIATANNGNVPFYSDGDGSTTFRMPKIVGYVKGASSQSESGSYIAEGLPNITGSIAFQDNMGLTHPSTSFSSGALTEGQTRSYAPAMATGYSSRDVALDASRSNSIYGNSDHVTPETSVVLFGVYAFGAIVETGALDATTLATGLARVESNLETKVDKTSAHIIETWSDGTNWYRKYSDGWVEQGGRVLGTKEWTIRNLNTAFTTTNYTLLGTNGGQSTDENFYSNTAQVKPVSTTTFKSAVYGANGIENIYWYACGY